MAVNTFGVNDTNAVKLWSRLLEVEALKATPISGLIGTADDSVILLRKELSKGPGDKVTFNLTTQLAQDGVTEGAVLEGNEEALTLYADSLLVNELNFAVRVKNEGTIDAQRIPVNLRDRAKDAMRDLWAKRFAIWFFNHVCGNTVQTDTRYTGFNATTAPSSGRIIRQGSYSDDTSITSSDTFNLQLVDKAKEAAMIASPMIKPLSIGGEDKFVMYLDPRQVTDMRVATSTGQWLDITKAAYQGKADNSPIYSGALGEYNGVILRKAADGMLPLAVTNAGVAVANTRRAVLLGAQAASIAFSNGGDTSTYNWVEKSFDYERELGVASRTIAGLKKNVFNSADYGSIVVSTYAAAHT